MAGAGDLRGPHWSGNIEFAPRVGHGTRGRLRAVTQAQPPPAQPSPAAAQPHRIFGLFTESLEFQYQVSCRICELRAQGENDFMYSWESVPPKCFCGKHMDWIARGPSQPPLLCYRRGPSCVADRMWQSHAWRCVSPGCAHGYQEICRGCVPGPISEDEPCSSDNQHFGFEATADKCTYSVVAAGGKLWIFVGDSCLHDNEVVWVFDPDSVQVERLSLPSHSDDELAACRRVVNACCMPDGRKIYFEAFSVNNQRVLCTLDTVSRTFETVCQMPPGAFRGRFVLAGGVAVGMADDGLYVLTDRNGKPHWERSTALPADPPSMPALGPIDGTILIFGADGGQEANSASLVRPQFAVDMQSCAAGQGIQSEGAPTVQALTAPVAVPSLSSASSGLLLRSLRYGSGAMGYLLFTSEGDVFRFRDEDILLPEQVWQAPRWDFSNGDPGIVTFSFAGGGSEEMTAHVYVLRRYEYFRRQLEGWAEGQTRTVSIEDVEPVTFGQLLAFAYTGEIDSSLPLAALTALLRAANKYLIADLVVAALRRLQRSLRTGAAVCAAPGEVLAQVLSTAEEVGTDGAALLQDASEAILLYRPDLLEDDKFLVPLARGSPAALRAVLAAFCACSTLNRAAVRWNRECGKLGPESRSVRPLWLAGAAGDSPEHPRRSPGFEPLSLAKAAPPPLPGGPSGSGPHRFPPPYPPPP